MTDRYTAEDFEGTRRQPDTWADNVIVDAALKIAARVAGPCLEDAIRTWDSAGKPSLWEHIRTTIEDSRT